MLSLNGYFILTAIIEIKRMDQYCPHCQALMILPKLVCDYGDMRISHHDYENSVFLPAEQLSKTSGGMVQRRCRFCKLAVYMPKMNRISAPLHVICPNCTSPLPACPLRHLPIWLSIFLAISIRILIRAVEITNAIQSWVRSL